MNPVWLITGNGTMEIDLMPVPDQPNPAQLYDIQPQPITAAWPFSTVQPGEYWTLPEAQRRIVEQTVAAMIAAMRQKDQDS